MVHFSEAVVRRFSVKKMLLKILQNSQENICARVSFLIVIKKETLAQVFSCEFYETFKSNLFIGHLRWLLLIYIRVGAGCYTSK